MNQKQKQQEKEKEKEIFQIYAEKSMPITAYDIKWLGDSGKFVLLGMGISGQGSFTVNEVVKGKKIRIIKTYQQSASIKCGSIGMSEISSRKLAVGDFSGNFGIWDLDEGRRTPIMRVQGAHTTMINSISCAGGGDEYSGYGSPEVCTGGHDGAVKLWDVRQKQKPIFQYAASSQTSDDCWSVALGSAHDNTNRLLASGHESGAIHLWDLRNTSVPLIDETTNQGVCSLSFDEVSKPAKSLLATCVNSTIAVLQIKDSELVKKDVSQSVGESWLTIWHGEWTQYTNAKNQNNNKSTFALSDSDGVVHLVKKEGKSFEFLHSQALSSQAIPSFSIHPQNPSAFAFTSFDTKARISYCSLFD
ncbi:wd repeat-containing protein [Anaeramoeba flamelloides]|uniref:Wd repeat-containing protein n=1 Tax=Anaeramoeba flamelloides TaxID=1746091 RepID=A0AAV7YJJ4_9EUKA|nr:wd repeat-containing protein [Anaeramoeba flamelloides]